MLGRATILLMTSQGFFLVSGYVANVALARILGVEDFGTFGVVMSFLLVVQLFVITGIPIALQKYVAENVDAARLILRKTLPWHLIYSLGVFAGFWLLAPSVADLLQDESLRFYLQIASIDIIFYGLYKYFLSMQNGLHQFGRQTLTGIAYAICKPLAIIVLIWLGYGITGAIIGNTLGSLGGLLIGIFIVRFPTKQTILDDIPFFRFAFTNVFYFVGLQLFFSMDIWFVKYYLNSEAVGEYVSASSVAKIPYFLSLAVSSALLPSVSRATKKSKEKRAKEIVSITLRYWFILLLAMVIVVGNVSEPLIVLFFGDLYSEGGSILAVLFAGIAFLTLAAVMNTILISRNKLGACLVVIGAMVLFHCMANLVLIPKLSGIGAAYATLVTAFLGILASGYLLQREMKVIIPLPSALRSVAASLIVFFVALQLPFFEGYLFLGIKCLVILLMFVLMLFVLKELNFADIKRFRTIMVPGKQS